MITEVQSLIDEANSISDDKIEEPGAEILPEHHLVGEITDQELKRLFTFILRKVRELDRLHHMISGPITVTKIIPEAIKEKMIQLQDEIDLLRNIFFYTISARKKLFGKPFVNVHKNWQISWSTQKPNDQMVVSSFLQCGKTPNNEDSE